MPSLCDLRVTIKNIHMKNHYDLHEIWVLQNTESNFHKLSGKLIFRGFGRFWAILNHSAPAYHVILSYISIRPNSTYLLFS